MNMKPNESCPDCQDRRKEFAEELAARPKVKLMSRFEDVYESNDEQGEGSLLGNAWHSR